MCRALGSSRTREKEPCDRVLSLPCGFHRQSFQGARLHTKATIIDGLAERAINKGHLCVFWELHCFSLLRSILFVANMSFCLVSGLLWTACNKCTTVCHLFACRRDVRPKYASRVAAVVGGGIVLRPNVCLEVGGWCRRDKLTAAIEESACRLCGLEGESCCMS